jgi:hypothetical protein
MMVVMAGGGVLGIAASQMWQHLVFFLSTNLPDLPILQNCQIHQNTWLVVLKADMAAG